MTSPTSGSPKKLRPVLVDLSKVQPGPRRWVWTNRLPRDELSVCDGDSGVGKSYALLSLVKTICEGGKFPDGEQALEGKVLYVDGESGAEEIKRRLEAAGLTAWGNVRVLSQIRNESGDLAFLDLDQAQHCEALEAAITGFKPDWVIIDPLVAFHRRNEIKATEVRRLMRYLSDLAREHEAAVTFVQHLNKAYQAPSQYRTRGSGDFVNAPRVALRVTLIQEPVTAGPGDWALEFTGARILEVLISNLGPKPPPLAFDIEDDRAIWYGQANSPVAGPRRRESRLQDATRFLVERLAQGPRPATEVEAAAVAAGHSPATLRRAHKALGIVPRKKADGWWWSLPGQDAQSANGGQDEHLEHLEHLPVTAVEQDDQDVQDVQQDQTSNEVSVPRTDPWD